MKTFFLTISIILSSVLFISCSSNDDEPTPPVEENQIIGEWSLIKREQVWATDFFNFNDVIWTFDQNQVLVEINLEEEDYLIRSKLFPFYVPGSFDYTINEDLIHFDLDYIPEEAEGYKNYPFKISYDTLYIGEVIYLPYGGNTMKFTLVRN